MTMTDKGPSQDARSSDIERSIQHPSIPISTEKVLKSDTNSADTTLHEYSLLTPPSQTIPTNPFDSGSNRHASSETPSILSQALRENQIATKQNNSNFGLGHETMTMRTSDPSNMINGLHIRTDVKLPRRSGSTTSIDSEGRLRTSASAASLPHRIPSVRAALHSTAGSLSPGSAISSPQIAAMLDITPLPSPTIAPFESWRTLSKTRSRGSSTSSKSDIPLTTHLPRSYSPSSPRRKLYSGLTHPPGGSTTSDGARVSLDENRERTRSISEYVPESMPVAKPRNVTVSGSGPTYENDQSQASMHREEFLGAQRGLLSSLDESNPSVTATDGFEKTHEDEPATKRPKLEVFTARSITTGQTRQYEAIRQLGQGTFSTVYLAVRQIHDRKDSVDYRQDSVNLAGIRARSKRMAAVKVVAHGPAGGADAERIEISLKREVELLKSVQHPSLVHLKAFGNDGNARALLVMNYCPGGDLFEVASTKLEVLTPPLVRRIFAELVSAVRYLHQKFIVHRDIKLENVLLNIPVTVHPDVSNWQTLDRAVVTLSDLGLSRRIPEPPESPFLTTRCGSEDYAAPEILMGQPYDGRQTDAWALGVLLYALMEGRLPFDPLPGARGDPATLRARTPHRIARCEWAWVRYGDEDGDWDSEKGKEMQGAFTCVDGLLKRNTRRKPLAEIRELPWVRDGIKVDGGLRWVDEEALLG